MASAAELIAHARLFRGLTENPPNSNCNPFSHYLGRPCHYWCADYTAAIFKQMGVPMASGANTSSTRMNLSAWKRANRWISPTQLQPGDVVFYHISGRNGPGQPDHTGIVTEGPEGNRILAMEGNTSSSMYGSQDNGGGVYERTRPLAYILGGGRPTYSITPPPLPQDEEEEMFILNPVTDGNDQTQYWVNGNVRVPLTPDEAQQFRNSGFGKRDMEPLAYAIFKQTNKEVPRP